MTTFNDSSAVGSAVERFHDEQVFTKFLCCVVCVNFTTIVSKIFTDTDLTVAGAHHLNPVSVGRSIESSHLAKSSPVLQNLNL